MLCVPCFCQIRASHFLVGQLLTGLCFALAVLVLPSVARAEVTAEKTDAGVRIAVDGELMAEYVAESGGKPIIYPIVGPTGRRLTRDYPMVEGDPSEREDHPHHRSLWFTHGDVNGLSYWHRETQKHRGFKRVASGEQAVVVAETDWLTPEGDVLLSDERTLTFGADEATRWIDFDITLRAADKPVHFGDTKEGTFGVRVAGTMKVDAKPVDSLPGGTIVNSHGHRDKKAWGKQAPWVDYHGPVDGKIVGLAIMNHPSSFRFPTYWHVRTYGLFAANPFGLHDFVDRSKDGSYTLKPGEPITLRYRVLLHAGDHKQARIAERFADYASSER